MRDYARRRAFRWTVREEDYLRLVAAGLGNKEIAARLWVTPKTVEKTLENVSARLGFPGVQRARLAYVLACADADRLDLACVMCPALAVAS